MGRYVKLEKKRLHTVEKIFQFFNDPSSSALAAAWAFCQGVLILLSATALFFNDYTPMLVSFEIFAILVFTFDYVVRLFTCPNVSKFVVEPMNILDLASFLPFYVMALLAMEISQAAQNPSVLIRIIRILRLGKLYRFAHLLQLAPPPPSSSSSKKEERKIMQSHEEPEIHIYPLPSEIIIDGIEGFNFPEMNSHVVRFELIVSGMENPEKITVELDDFRLQQSFIYSEPIALPLLGIPPYKLTLKLSIGRRDSALSYTVELSLNTAFLTSFPDGVIHTLRRRLDRSNDAELVVYLKVKRNIIEVPEESSLLKLFDFTRCLEEQEEETVQREKKVHVITTPTNPSNHHSPPPPV